MAVRLALVLADFVDAVEDPAVSNAAAAALEDTMREGVARKIGADQRMSGFPGGAVEYKIHTRPGIAELRLGGGTYGLADGGRRRKRRRIRAAGRKRKGQRRPALRTPYGPRTQVKGSRWTGFHLTDTVGPVAVGKAVEAAAREVVRRFALAA